MIRARKRSSPCEGNSFKVYDGCGAVSKSPVPLTHITPDKLMKVRRLKNINDAQCDAVFAFTVSKRGTPLKAFFKMDVVK